MYCHRCYRCYDCPYRRCQECGARFGHYWWYSHRCWVKPLPIPVRPILVPVVRNIAKKRSNQDW